MSDSIDLKELLTEHALNILRLVAQDVPQKEIAFRFSISPKTVNMHVSLIKKKLGVDGIAGMTRLAIRHGLVEP